ncbi:MAG: Uma2 family endonuclease [Planctomycetes bacterium]|nr:Uma2 family endonuclease [Planctomycetota bacterium]
MATATTAPATSPSTSSTAPHPLSLLQALPAILHRFSVNDYHRMIEHGILREDQRVELLDGWIVPKMPHNPRHSSAIQKSTRTMAASLPNQWDLRVQLPITLEQSEPEPDLAVVRFEASGYAQRHPSAADVGTLIEASDTSLADDRQAKTVLYARAGIPSYWILNLVGEDVEVFEDPTGPDPAPRYRRSQTFRRGESVPLVLDGVEVARIRVDDLLP